MNLAGVRPRDIVECDVRGRRFYATVEAKRTTPGTPARLQVRPITPGINYFEVPARQVVGHWRRSLQSIVRPAKPAPTRNADVIDA